MIEAEYTITYADYKAAQWLYLRERRVAMVGYLVAAWAVPTFGICILALAFWSRIHSTASGADQSGLMIASLWLVVAFPLIRWMRLRRGYRDLFPKGTPKITRITVNEDQVISALPDRNEGRYYWNSIVDHAEAKSGMILFVGKKQFLIVPHRALDEAQWMELRALVAAKAPRS